MSDEDLADLRAELRVMKREFEAMHADVRKLVTAEARREGREEAAAKDGNYRHDDRWQVWVRALVPTGLLTAGWLWLWRMLTGGTTP
jgi:hypothetical protein